MRMVVMVWMEHLSHGHAVACLSLIKFLICFGIARAAAYHVEEAKKNFIDKLLFTCALARI